jgi:hypothetical protein
VQTIVQRLSEPGPADALTRRGGGEHLVPFPLDLKMTTPRQATTDLTLTFAGKGTCLPWLLSLPPSR